MDDTVREGQLLWTPGPEAAEATLIARFMRALAEDGRPFADYEALRRWSVEDLEGFWAAVWDFFQVVGTRYERVLGARGMPGARWFEGSRVNYAEHMLRHESTAPDAVAALHSSELRPLARVTWRELADAVRTMAGALRAHGIEPGDRVVAYMPNVIETLVAMLATTALGAVWASAAPEFGAKTVVDRFAQIEPKLLFAVDGYRFGGKAFDRCDDVAHIVAALPSLKRVVWLDYLGCGRPRALAPEIVDYADLLAGPAPDRATFAFERVASDHPLWILFSSGTTGLPKAIVHGHAGIVLELLKSALNGDGGPDRRTFFYTTTGWMMWNALVSSLLLGTSIVLYDGHPAHPGPDLLWRLAEECEATGFGASPTYVGIMQKLGLVPKERFDLSRLRSVLLTGSPVTPESAAWFYRNVKEDLWVSSPSGGTELCAALAAGCPILPVYAGEIQTRALGMDVHAWDAAGNAVIDEIGELVVTSPSPSMPLYFWNDPDGRKYREAYFETYPGVWRHGDFLKINERGGCYIYGRSDSTLNRFGVRIGTAEIYRVLDRIPDVADALIVCLEEPGGTFYMPLFVKLTPGTTFDDALRAGIVERLRREGSPRHVPDVIIEAPAIPYTLTGKRMEIPVRRLLAGADPATVASREAMSDPTALDFYRTFARERTRQSPG